MQRVKGNHLVVEQDGEGQNQNFWKTAEEMLCTALRERLSKNGSEGAQARPGPDMPAGQVWGRRRLSGAAHGPGAGTGVLPQPPRMTGGSLSKALFCPLEGKACSEPAPPC